MSKILATVVMLLAVVIVYTQLTIFVVPPIGAVPEGRTIVLWRYSIDKDGKFKGINLDFIDSADAVCARQMSSVNLLCRGMVLGMVASNSTILLRLPYIGFLHSIADGNVR